MIIQNPSPADVKRREVDAERLATNDLPPSYTPSAAGPSSFISQPPMQPHNFVTLSRDNNSIKGHWLLDPSLSVPRSMLPELLEGETEGERRNFNVVGKYGSVDVGLWIAALREDGNGGEGEGKRVDVLGRKRTGIYVKAENGSCKVAIHDSPSSPSSSSLPSVPPPTPKRLPFKLTIEATHGQVTLDLPRSFHGLLTFINEYGSLKLSPSLSSSVYTFSEMNGTRKCFIGDYSLLHDLEGGVDEWEGDEVKVEATYGGTRVRWVDEVDGGSGSGKGSWFLRLFGV